MPSSTKTLDAWVVGGRHRHHRSRDHFGADSDLFTVLSAPIGPWAAGTPIKYVVEDLYTRLTSLETTSHQVRVAHLNAYVLAPSVDSAPAVPGVGLGVKTLDAWVFSTRSSSFTINADIRHHKIFTLDAIVAFRGVIYLNAFVV